MPWVVREKTRVQVFRLVLFTPSSSATRRWPPFEQKQDKKKKKKYKTKKNRGIIKATPKESDVGATIRY